MKNLSINKILIERITLCVGFVIQLLSILFRLMILDFNLINCEDTDLCVKFSI